MVLVLAVAATGCTGDSFSRATTAGSTLLLPIAGDDFEYPFGSHTFHTYAYSSALGGQDLQRGHLVAFACPTGSPMATACWAHPTRVDLDVRFVTRLQPDSTSLAAIEGYVHKQEFLSPDDLFVPLAGQVVAVVEIPVGAAQLFENETYCPNDCEEIPLQLFVRRVPPGETDFVVNSSTWDDPDYQIRLVRGSPMPTSEETQQGGTDVSYDWERLVPLPALLLRLDSSPAPAAAELLVSYPAGVQIRDVIEHQSAGRRSFTQWSTDGEPANHVRIHLVAPESDIGELALVFSIDNPLIAPVGLQGFSVVSDVLYDSNGAELAGSVTPYRIR